MLWRGKTVLEWVWRATCDCETLSKVTIATGDDAIRSAAEEFGATVHFDRAPYRNGTERTAGAFEDRADHVVVVQADQPGLQTAHLSMLVRAMATAKVDMVTPGVPLDHVDIHNPDVVKCWSDANGQACFSRQPPTSEPQPRLWRHVGLYGYRASALRKYATSGPCEAEEVERLEQLRCLEMGQQVRLISLPSAAPCVDRPGDLEKLTRWFSRSTR
jgi:3-deoxy-manno-octulosonate cytidylyltransferase (CMP-KDO synthetase)